MCHNLAKNLIKWCEKTSVIDENHYIKAAYGMEVFLENIWKLIGFLLIGIWVENRVPFFVAIASFSLLRILVGGGILSLASCALGLLHWTVYFRYMF